MIKEQNSICESIFKKLIQVEPEVKGYRKFVERELPSNWGQRKGGLKRAKQLLI